MNKVVDLKQYASNRAVARSKKRWKSLFPEDLTSQTKLGDLSDRTILTLANLGQDVMQAIYDMIMGLLDFDPKLGFDDLTGQDKLRILDASLFLIDQVRWECLRRIGWVSGFAAEEHALVDLVLENEMIKKEFNPCFPSLNPSHPNYEEFLRRRDIDGEAMIRSMIPAALAAFTQRV
jgi:hypothetical protein